jgi:single-stranded DNA-binding protein
VLWHSEGGIAQATFRMAVSGRRDGEPSCFTVVAWRDEAEHPAESLTKGSRVTHHEALLGGGYSA